MANKYRAYVSEEGWFFYWSVPRQQQISVPCADLSDYDLEDMPPQDQEFARREKRKALGQLVNCGLDMAQGDDETVLTAINTDGITYHTNLRLSWPTTSLPPLRSLLLPLPVLPHLRLVQRLLRPR